MHVHGMLPWIISAVMLSGTNCNDANVALSARGALKYGSLSQVVCYVVVLETASVEPAHLGGMFGPCWG